MVAKNTVDCCIIKRKETFPGIAEALEATVLNTGVREEQSGQGGGRDAIRGGDGVAEFGG